MTTAQTNEQLASSTAARADGQRERLVTALQAWQKARDEAARYNRNLLQYAASIAAVLGIGAGSGGLFAVANSLPEAHGDIAVIGLMAAAGVAAVIAVPLVLLLAWAFRKRGQAETAAVSRMNDLIEIDPKRFPAGEE
jgi:O-antigen/teichoic acid export membrane protein